MRPRETPAPAGSGHRFWVVDLNPEGTDAPDIYAGPHQFKAPRYSVMLALREAYAEAGLPPFMSEDRRVLLRHLRDAEAVVGAYIGACWASRVWTLDTPTPKRGATAAEWLDYGEAVQDELQDVEDFTATRLHLIGFRCVAEVEMRIQALTQAADTADFGSGRTDSPDPAEGAEEEAPSTSAASGTSSPST